MSNAFVPSVGAVFSADIAVPDHAREVRFYSRVLSTGSQPLWRESDLMNNLGMPIIGLGQRGPAYEKLPLQWMPHFQVADVAASVQRAVAQGGTLLMDAKADGGSTQWAVLLDPNGAAFGIVPVVPAGALPPIDPAAAAAPMGRIGWVDLTVPNAEAMRDFYCDVIGWSPEDVAMRDGIEGYADYNMLRADGHPGAGVCHARGGNAGLPPVWMIYLPVADMAESLRRVAEEGGTVLKAVQGKNGQYVYAAVRDPVGAVFALAPG